MLDVYEMREGSFEIVDTQAQELRAKQMLYYRLVRFVIILLVVFTTTFVLIASFTQNIFWVLPTLVPIGLIYFAYKNLQLLKKRLSPKISSVLLEYDKEKNIRNFKIRRWLPVKVDEFTEEEIRYNQATGFKFIWFDDGYIDVEIIVDPEFPGVKIFETYDFLAAAELSKLFAIGLPSLSTRLYKLEDQSQWSQEHIQEFKEEVKSARIPWIVREYFTQL